jgi:hypothetical protein
MNWEEIGAIGQVLGSVAVFITLVYLSVQTRQSIRHTRALIHQGASARTTSITLWHAGSPEAMATWLEGNGEPPTPESNRKARFALMCQTSVTALEDIFSQHNDGLMEEEVFARNCYVHIGLLAEPGYRAYWNAQRVELSRIAPKFVAFVDGLCVEEATKFGFRL